MKNVERLEGYRKDCPICGREFYAASIWAYKTGYDKSHVYYCSWKCLQAKRQSMKHSEKKRVVEE